MRPIAPMRPTQTWSLAHSDQTSGEGLDLAAARPCQDPPWTSLREELRAGWKMTQAAAAAAAAAYQAAAAAAAAAAEGAAARLAGIHKPCQWTLLPLQPGRAQSKTLSEVPLPT